MRGRLPTARTGAPLVGRSAELGVLSGYLDAAATGSGRVVLLCGEPGIGKSSTARVVAERGRDSGASVAWGHCRETEGAPAFWPWTQVLRTLLARSGRPPPGGLRLLLEPGAGAPDREDRFALFAAVSELLVELAAVQPLVLLLDDLHRADVPSLRLLEFLAPVVQDASLLVLGTFRDSEIRAGHRLLALVDGDADLVRLPALTVDDTAQLVARTAPTCRLTAAQLHERSAGNPFFLQELLRLRPEQSGAVPLTVQAAIHARVGRLPAQTRALLNLAAVLGREFPAALLGAMADTPLDVVDAGLEPALASGLLGPAPLGSYRFSHVLVRDALYEAMPPAPRAGLHDRAVHALGQPAADVPCAADLRASHALHAVRTPGERRRAVRLTEQAGAAARDRLAHEEAAAWFARAAELCDGDPAEQLRLLLELARCAGRAGQAQPSRVALRRAWTLATAAGWDARLPEVALALGEVVDSAGSVDAELVHMLEHALDRTAPDVRLGRVRLTARLATELYWTPRLTEARGLAADAVAAARRLGDRRALAVAVAAQQFALRGPDDLHERTRLGEELVDAARHLGDEVLELHARRLLLADRLQTDRTAAETDLAGLDALATSTRRPLVRWYVLVNRCVLAPLANDPAAALHLVRETEELGRRLGAAPARMYAVVQRFALLRQQGCGARLEDELRARAAEYPRLATLRCDLVLLLAEADRTEEAAPLLEQLVADDCAAVPRDALWLASLCVLVLAAARLGRTSELAVLERLLAPYAGRIVLQGLAVWWGAVDHYLGCAYVGLGQLESAERAHRRALRLHHAWAAEPFVQLSQDAITDVAGRRAADRGTGAAALTARERQVLQLLQGGAANKQIARELGISIHTVERHLTNLYAKIGARSRSQATALGLTTHP